MEVGWQQHWNVLCALIHIHDRLHLCFTHLSKRKCQRSRRMHLSIQCTPNARVSALDHAMTYATALVHAEHLVVHGRQILSLLADQSPVDLDVQLPSVVMALDAVEDTFDALTCSSMG